MDLLDRLIQSISAVFKTDDLDPIEREKFSARLGRYRIAHALVSGTLDNPGYSWLENMRETLDVYKFMRSLKTAQRMVGFYGELVWQDIDQGIANGKRYADQLFTRSDWLMKDELFVTNGATFGDCFIRVLDEFQGAVLESVSPLFIRDIEKTRTGEVTYYELQKDVDVGVAYGETCEQVGIDAALFTTYRNGQEHHWPGNPASSWYVDYSVPLVHAKFLPSNDKWGRSPVTKMQAELLALNGLLSIVVDRIRKTEPLLVVQGPKGMVKSLTFEEAETRDDIKVLAAVQPLNADAQSNSSVDYVVPQLHIDDLVEMMDHLDQQLKSEHPMLSLLDAQYATDTAEVPSGRALHYLQMPVAHNVQSVRQRLDRALERAVNLAGTIDSLRGANSVATFALTRERPVFKTDADWQAELTTKHLAIAQQMQAVGIDPTEYLIENGVIEEDTTLTPPTEEPVE